MPAAFEKEDLELLKLLRKHSNRPKGQTSGPCLRSVKAVSGEVVEVFPAQKSWDQIREKIELIEVVEANLHPEVGTGGRARRKVLETPAPDYFAIDLYSDEVLNEEILFQGRLNKFQAGFKTSFIPKWIIVTKSSFRYYRNMEVSI